MLTSRTDRHIALLSGESTAPNATPTPGGSPYDSLNADAKTHVDARLRRASDFFGTVVCRFVLRDIGLLLDKHGTFHTLPINDVDLDTTI